MIESIGPQSRQDGLALLLVMVVLVLATLAFIAQGLTSRSLRLDQNKKTERALAQAKDALIAYAVTYSETHLNNVPGYLPCPDTGTAVEGTSAATCGAKNVSSLRRFPWRTLGAEALKDSASECLWYAVSGTFKNSPQTDLMNWDNSGLIEVVAENGQTLLTGSSPESRAAAVVIAPGPAIGGQNRTKSASALGCGGNYVASNYLDNYGVINNATLSPTANGISRLIAARESDNFNDRIIFITSEEIFAAIRKRKDFQTRLEKLTESIAKCVAKYGELNGTPMDHRLPWPAPVNLANFNTNASYNDSAAGSLKSGRLPFVVDTSKITTNNGMSGNNLLSGTNNLCPFWNADDTAWYQNWKDHFFYVLAGSFAPTAANPTILPCPTCVTVNGGGSYAAVVLFAENKMSGQSRNTVAEKGLIRNYLEGRNSTNHPNSSGNGNYEKSALVNDLLYCIAFDPITHVSTVFACP